MQIVHDNEREIELAAQPTRAFLYVFGKFFLKIKNDVIFSTA